MVAPMAGGWRKNLIKQSLSPLVKVMRIRTNIAILLAILVFFIVASTKGYSQDSLPAEKKRALSKFDPAEVFPQTNDRARDNSRRRSNNADSTSPRDQNGAAALSDSS